MLGATTSQALAISAVAGGATLIGAAVALLTPRPGPRFLAFTLGLSAGAMATVTVVELVPTAITSIGWPATTLAVALGAAIYALIDRAIPHDYVGQFDRSGLPFLRRVRRVGALSAIGIVLHNVPEGVVTFTGALEDLSLGIAIGVAVAVHNVPEGVAVTAPIMAATGRRPTALGWALAAGLSEPAGALLAATGLGSATTPTVLGATLAGVGGLMLAIALDELLPQSTFLRQPRATVLGVLSGAAVMGFSLLLLGRS